MRHLRRLEAVPFPPDDGFWSFSAASQAVNFHPMRLRTLAD